MRGRPKGSGIYTERQRFLIRVMFLYGCSPAEIARLMGMYGCPMTSGMASGQIAALDYRKKDMPRAMRQRLLDQVKLNRLDLAGRQMGLPDHFFYREGMLTDLRKKRRDCYRAGDPDFDRRRQRFYGDVAYGLAEPPALVVPLAGHYGFEPETVKRRAAFYADCARVFGWLSWNLDPEPCQSSMVKPGRDGKPREVEKYGNAGIHSYRDQASDAMTWLILNKHLNSKVDWPRSEEKLELAWSEGNARHTTAQELERIFEKAELTPIKSPDWEAVPGGGFGSRYVPLGKLVAQMMVQDLRREMPPSVFRLLERILVKNDHPWHGLKKKAQDAVLQDVRFALDFAGWVLMKLEVGQAGDAAVERARQALAQKWEAAAQFFYQKRLRPALHAGKVERKIKTSTR